MLVISIIIVLMIISGSIFLRKNTTNADKIGLIFLLTSFMLIILLVVSFSLGVTDVNFSLRNFSNPFSFQKKGNGTSSLKSNVAKSKNIKREEPYENQTIYIVGKDIPAGEYILPKQGQYDIKFRIVSADKTRVIFASY